MTAKDSKHFVRMDELQKHFAKIQSDLAVQKGEVAAQLRHLEEERELLEKEKKELLKEIDIQKQQQLAEVLEEKEKVRIIRESLEAEKIRIADHTLKSSTKIKLDVGGKYYSSSITTLTSVPNSMLASLFSGRFSLQKDSDGTFFVDRDGKLFGYILEWLRNNSLSYVPEKLVEALIVEATYYGLPALVEDLEQMQATSNPTSQERLIELIRATEGEQMQRKDLCGLNLQNRVLAGAYLPAYNFSFTNFKKANLQFVDLTQANLTNANLENANLTNANLTKANLTNTNLKNTNQTNTNLTDSYKTTFYY